MNICKEIALIIIVCIINIFCGFFVEQNNLFFNIEKNNSQICKAFKKHFAIVNTQNSNPKISVFNKQSGHLGFHSFLSGIYFDIKVYNLRLTGINIPCIYTFQKTVINAICIRAP